MCRQCELNPVYEFTNKRKLCRNCFIRYFHKKFLYTLRKFKMISGGNKIKIEKNKDFRNVVLKNLLEDFKIRLRIDLNSRNFDKRAVADNIDLDADKIINYIVKKNIFDLDKNLSPVDSKNKIIRPLYLFTDKEILLYAKIKSLNYENKIVELDKWSRFINKLEEKHPEIKRAIVNSYLELFKD